MVTKQSMAQVFTSPSPAPGGTCDTLHSPPAMEASISEAILVAPNEIQEELARSQRWEREKWERENRVEGEWLQLAGLYESCWKGRGRSVI